MNPGTTTAVQGTRRLGFENLDEEVAVDRLELRGEFPEWLAGSLVRVTPALLDVGGKPLRHWFDGIAMLNSFSFEGGAVSYGSRFLQTDAYRQARAGKLDMFGFAHDPCRSLFKRVTTMFSPPRNDNTNVNLSRLGESYIAMTELPLPVEFDPRTLETVGLVEWKDELGGQVTTAHPHLDRDRGELVNYVARFGPRTSYRVFGVPPGSRSRREIASIPVREPAYMHSFGISERYVVLAEFPLVVNPLRLATSALAGRPFIDNYEWKPDRGTRFLAIDRATGELRGPFEAEPFFGFHHVNAFERDGELVVDLIAYEDASIIDVLEIERLRDPEGGLPGGRLRRCRVPLAGGQVRTEPLADAGMDLPRINYRSRNERSYRYAYGAGLRDADSDWFDQIVKVDVTNGEVNAWFDDGCYPGEAVFVPAPEADAEDEGVVLSVVLDPAAGRSFLVALDAGSFEELGRAAAPHHIPFGFHGQYFPSD
ncbi:MAG: carotenoid oxygenase family protein [Solirubrobacterales bacterium]